MAKKSTISDIARALGVSKALVSFVLNGKSKEKRISDEMTARVIEVAKELNYAPNYHARSLRRGRSNTLGLIVADISNPFFAKLAHHIEIEASRYNYKIIISNSDEQREKFATQLDLLKNGQVDGFILTPPIGSEEALHKLRRERVPFVVVDRRFEALPGYYVVIDNYRAAFDATERLIANGCRNVALLNVNNELLTMRQRSEGYLDALIRNGLGVRVELIRQLPFSHEKERVMAAIREVVAHGADGLLFTTNKIGVLGMECLRELGVRIPEELKLVSFDDTEAYRVSYTPVTAIVQPLEQMSKEAVRLVMESINSKQRENTGETLVLDVEFVYRQSCP